MSSTIKPFDLASWVRKLLLLQPIFLSTRNILTSWNLASSRLEKPASGFDLFFGRGATGAWDISSENSWTSGNSYCYDLFICCCVQRLSGNNAHFGRGTVGYLCLVALWDSVSVKTKLQRARQRSLLATGVEDLVFTKKTTCQDWLIKNTRGGENIKTLLICSCSFSIKAVQQGLTSWKFGVKKRFLPPSRVPMSFAILVKHFSQLNPC